MIANGTHPELVTLMAEIEEKKGKRIHSAEAWRKHQHANFKQQFEGFEYQANIHFIVIIKFSPFVGYFFFINFFFFRLVTKKCA